MNSQLQLPFDKRKRKPRPAVQLETNALTRAIILHLKSLGGYAVRVNTTGLYDPERKIWRKGITDPGCPDVFALIGGKLIGIEIKSKYDRLSKPQERTRQAIIGAGGYYVVAKDIASFRTNLKEILKSLNP